eukprot:g2450.t1
MKKAVAKAAGKSPDEVRAQKLKAVKKELHTVQKHRATHLKKGGACCFEIGYGSMMAPCCLKTQLVPAGYTCEMKKRFGGETGFAMHCPSTAEEAHSILKLQKHPNLDRNTPCTEYGMGRCLHEFACEWSHSKSKCTNL